MPKWKVPKNISLSAFSSDLRIGDLQKFTIKIQKIGFILFVCNEIQKATTMAALDSAYRFSVACGAKIPPGSRQELFSVTVKS